MKYAAIFSLSLMVLLACDHGMIVDKSWSVSTMGKFFRSRQRVPDSEEGEERNYQPETRT